MPGRDNYKSVYTIALELDALKENNQEFIRKNTPVSPHQFKALIELFEAYINTKEMGH